jgi:alpha-L-fucosidase
MGQTAGIGTLKQSLAQHRAPQWWRDAHLGIFIHWGPYSIPAFAPTDVHIGEVMATGRRDAMSLTPYVEWYQNSLRFPESPAARHHREVHNGRAYHDFGPMFEEGLASWDPDAWARAFAASGARYVVLVTKHHDGFCLWPTEVRNPHRTGWATTRDVVGELAEAVRGVGLRFGVYYSGGLDWTWNEHPIGTVTDLALAQPRGAYIDYATQQVRELIDRYRPSVLWNDISWPSSGRHLWPLLAEYYEKVHDGAINDRFLPWSPPWLLARVRPVARAIDRAAARSAAQDKGIIPPKPPVFDYQTPEYTVFPEPRRIPFEMVRGMDGGFGYNAFTPPDAYIGRDDLLGSLDDVVTKGGNLLLNVGPRGEDAQIPEIQLERLRWLGEHTGQPDAR